MNDELINISVNGGEVYTVPIFEAFQRMMDLLDDAHNDIDRLTTELAEARERIAAYEVQILFLSTAIKGLYQGLGETGLKPSI